MKTIDDYIEQRNAIQLRAEALGEERARSTWLKLGVANRHISRIVSGQLILSPQVEWEIQKCLERAEPGDVKA